MTLVRWIGAALLATGSVGLIGSMLTDVVAVTGRHTGWPFGGSIEVSQAFIAIGAASAIAYASMSATHAAVDLVFHRLPISAQRIAHRGAAVLGFLFVAGLVTGSAWIAWEYRGAAETTEILRIPIQWLRLFWVGCSLIAAVALLAPAFARRPEGEPR